MRLAVFTVALPEWTPEQALRILADQGWDGIEWRVLDAPDAAPGVPPSFWSGNRCTIALTTFPAQAAELAARTAAAGLATPGVGAYARCHDLDEVDLALAGTAALGGGQVRIRVPDLGSGPYTEVFATTRRQYAEVARRAAAHGVKALVETHHATVVSSPSAALRLLDGLDPESVGVLYDIGNQLCEGGENVLAGLEMLGPYLAHVHVKNGRWAPTALNRDSSPRWEFDWAPLRSGQADLRALFAALRRVGYDSWVSCEDFSTEVALLERTADDLALLRELDRG